MNIFDQKINVIYHYYLNSYVTPQFTFKKKQKYIPRKNEKVYLSNYGDHETIVFDVIHYPEPKGSKPYVIIKLERL